MSEKNFSILKWIIFPLLVAAFGSGIIYVSLTIFGLAGSVPSILLVCICLAISLIFILHTSNHQVKSAMIAAFTFECLGVVALGITLICSIVVLRQFSGATQTIEAENKLELAKGDQKTEQIKALSTIKSRSAQSTLAKDLTPTPTPKPKDGEKTEKLTLASVYELAEKLLLWPLIGEASVYLLGLLVVFGLVQFGNIPPETPLETVQETPINTRNRVTFLARNQIAPLQIANQPRHKVENGNGFALSLAAQGDGVSIRFQERGSLAKHVIRVTRAVAEKNNLETLNYTELAKWSLKALRNSGKESKPIYKKIEETL